jgi:hypothetical protein
MVELTVIVGSVQFGFPVFGAPNPRLVLSAATAVLSAVRSALSIFVFAVTIY